MEFYAASHGKFHDRRCPDIFYGINIIDNLGFCTREHSVTTITWQLPYYTTYIGWAKSLLPHGSFLCRDCIDVTLSCSLELCFHVLHSFNMSKRH